MRNERSRHLRRGLTDQGHLGSNARLTRICSGTRPAVRQARIRSLREELNGFQRAAFPLAQDQFCSTIASLGWFLKRLADWPASTAVASIRSMDSTSCATSKANTWF